MVANPICLGGQKLSFIQLLLSQTCPIEGFKMKVEPMETLIHYSIIPPSTF